MLSGMKKLVRHAMRLISEFLESYRVVERPDRGLKFRISVPSEFANLWRECFNRLVVGPGGLPELTERIGSAIGQAVRVDSEAEGPGARRLIDCCVDGLAYRDVKGGGLEVHLEVPEHFTPLWLCALEGVFVGPDWDLYLQLDGTPEDYA